MRLTFYPIAESFTLVAVAALALGLLLLIGPPRRKTTPGRRRWLAALRLAVIALLTMAMLRPTLVYTEVRKQAATLVVLADRSRSMSVPDGAGGKTRYQTLQQVVADARPAWWKPAQP